MMLIPDNRRLFRDVLRPPIGYQFDRGIGTTFTLDLLTLLVTPLSMSIHDWTDVEETSKDPLVLLEGLRRYADRLAIFCQAGYIQVPAVDNHLYRWLEEIIVEVKAPKSGVFHPKVWLLRYISEDRTPIYRFINMSRNLTFDKSWDLMLRLDGQVDQAPTATVRNIPLADFLSELPNLAIHSVIPRIKQNLEDFRNDVHRVKFQPPQGFEREPKFYPMGIPKYRNYHFNKWITRFLVISPFLNDNYLSRIAQFGKGHVLISREESIDALAPETSQSFSTIYVLDDMAAQGVSTQLNEGDDQDLSMTPNGSELAGLHAKLFVGDLGWEAVWLIGSANATEAAFEKNVEFMVEMVGKKSKVGIDVILGSESDKQALRNILIPYETREPRTENKDDKRAEQLADEIRRWLLEINLQLQVVENNKDLFDLKLSVTNPKQAKRGKYQIHCWPISLSEKSRLELYAQESHDQYCFVDLSLLNLTPFIAFEVTTFIDKVKFSARFVLKLPITGIPAHRDDMLISAIISGRAQFLRYLRLLLSEEENAVSSDGWISTSYGGQSDSYSWDFQDLPILEQLVRALSRSPDKKIDRIADIVERLKRSPQGKAIMGEEFDSLWNLIIIARNKML